MGYVPTGLVRGGDLFGAPAQTETMTLRTEVTRPAIIVKTPPRRSTAGAQSRILAKPRPTPPSLRRPPRTATTSPAKGRVITTPVRQPVAPTKSGVTKTILVPGAITTPGGRVRKPGAPTKRPPGDSSKSAPVDKTTAVEQALDKTEAEAAATTTSSGTTSGGGGGGGGAWTWWKDEQPAAEFEEAVVVPEPDDSGWSTTTWLVLGGAALAAAYFVWGK